MTKKVIITVEPDSKTTVTASGYTGADCYKATAPFEELLGDDRTDKKTEDFYKGNGQLRERESE